MLEARGFSIRRLPAPADKAWLDVTVRPDTDMETDNASWAR